MFLTFSSSFSIVQNSFNHSSDISFTDGRPWQKLSDFHYSCTKLGTAYQLLQKGSISNIFKVAI